VHVASLDTETKLELAKMQNEPASATIASHDGHHGDVNRSRNPANEALMILGVDGEVTREVLDDLRKPEGILNVSLVRL
jgi:D-3-phosphoglycerate dehydrogenase